jgi:hypothetical protein
MGNYDLWVGKNRSPRPRQFETLNLVVIITNSLSAVGFLRIRTYTSYSQLIT